MIAPETARIFALIAVFALLSAASLWQAFLARAALDDTEFGVPGWPLQIAVWAVLQTSILAITYCAGVYL